MSDIFWSYFRLWPSSSSIKQMLVRCLAVSVSVVLKRYSNQHVLIDLLAHHFAKAFSEKQWKWLNLDCCSKILWTEYFWRLEVGDQQGKGFSFPEESSHLLACFRAFFLCLQSSTLAGICKGANPVVRVMSNLDCFRIRAALCKFEGT